MIDKILYGVWLPGIGWLKANSEAVVFESSKVAIDTARRISNGATAEYIDQSLVDLENQLLEAEQLKKKRSFFIRFIMGD